MADAEISIVKLIFRQHLPVIAEGDWQQVLSGAHFFLVHGWY